MPDSTRLKTLSRKTASRNGAQQPSRAKKPHLTLKSQSGRRKSREAFHQSLIQSLPQSHAPKGFRPGYSRAPLQVQSFKYPVRAPQRTGQSSVRSRRHSLAIYEVRPGSAPRYKARVPSRYLVIIIGKHREFSTAFGPVIQRLIHNPFA